MIPYGYSVGFKKRKGSLKWIDVPGEGVTVEDASRKAREYYGRHGKNYGREYGIIPLRAIEITVKECKSLYQALSDICREYGLDWSMAGHWETRFLRHKERVFTVTPTIYLKIV